MAAARRVAVVGGGWAGLAAAVEATRRGQHVALYEMAPQLGGRARAVDFGDALLDNGQHILIGAYSQTLSLMRFVGVDLDQALLRTPLKVTYPDGAGLQLQPGSPLVTFAAAVLRYPGWGWREKRAMLTASTAWALKRFRCDASLTVSQLTARLPPKVRDELLDPLCVAALNTPAPQASAAVFLRVLKDALFSGPGSADLLLPRQRLSELWPAPAARWLKASGATVHLSRRVERLAAAQDGWQLDGETFDAVVLACTANEAARLTATIAPTWSAQAAELRYEPIVTVYAQQSAPQRLPQPMMALRSDDGHPAQFAFDLGALGGPAGVIALVVSGAAEWVARGMSAVEEATLRQAHAAFGGPPLQRLRTTTEKRATFLCTPGLRRPAQHIAAGLLAAGDYVEGPYPATLEGATRSGRAAGMVV
ncbi:hydroxysqualene dehydroxylase HpnE [Piscinibacter sp. HJYY11]|uniref:hydroxysqualene dehydroxylase HpnE n=1 Tax=Piscinibacter sp. HJYY11 TaxID=2801333 RepID=UPI00191FF177|nr:hydroxysqualene dehydroxylase HpnE [Piscinibacter sp. HJYY11]MBL0726816.1 FAD-dependent oxidoreductase [Piscinibacter sp. HJYY11]